jgi:Glycosyl transferase family 11
MITCDLKGGLGNQLFQIFATISYSIKTSNPFKFLNLQTLGGNGCTLRYTFWQTFLENLKPFLVNSLPQIVVIRESGFHFNELPIEQMRNRDVLINGYFQSYKYFQHNYASICRLINLEKMRKTVLDKVCATSEDFSRTVSVHFRIGDYKKVLDFHPLATYEYYHRSLTHIKNNCASENQRIMYFCEDVDLEEVLEKIQKLEKEFDTFKFVRGDNTLADWEQLLLMSCCHHNVIANSSFSWWAAYFNSHSDKIICYPSVWFGPASGNMSTNDLCPPAWCKIPV